MIQMIRKLIYFYKNIDPEIKKCIHINLFIFLSIFSTFLPWFRYYRYLKSNYLLRLK